MVRGNRPESEDSPKFVWQTDDPAASGDAPEPESGGAVEVPAKGDEVARKEAEGRRGWFSGRALVAAAVIAPVVGVAVGFAVFGGGHSSAVTTVVAARVSSSPEVFYELNPSFFATTSLSASPSPKPTPSKSKTESATHAVSPSTAPARVVTTTAAAVAPATSHTTSSPKPVGEWLLNGNALDSTGAHNGLANDVTWSGGAAVFNGSSSSDVITSGPVLSTGKGDGFTVSVWVDLTTFPVAPHYASTAVSQDGSTNSSFYLQYFQPGNCWAFAMPGANQRAVATSTPKLNTWTHLVGVYNAANNTQYLYLNGALQGTATESAPTASTGSLAIGRAQYDGSSTDGFYGSIKDVRVFDVALSAAEVSALG